MYRRRAGQGYLLTKSTKSAKWLAKRPMQARVLENSHMAYTFLSMFLCDDRDGSTPAMRDRGRELGRECRGFVILEFGNGDVVRVGAVAS
jgi:hypothetical protein